MDREEIERDLVQDPAESASVQIARPKSTISAERRATK